jgi:hypothetical protein
MSTQETTYQVQEGALPRLGMAAGLEHFIGEAVGGGDFGVHSRFGV